MESTRSAFLSVRHVEMPVRMFALGGGSERYYALLGFEVDRLALRRTDVLK